MPRNSSVVSITSVTDPRRSHDQEHSLSRRPAAACAGPLGRRKRGHSDHAAARSALASIASKEGLAATQSASVGARIFRPSCGSVQHIFACGNAGTQKIRRSSRPCAAHSHNLTHESGHGVSLDDAFDRGPTVGVIGIPLSMAGRAAWKSTSSQAV
jgi:hypothetical protein